jgi:hypothetical protein
LRGTERICVHSVVAMPLNVLIRDPAAKPRPVSPRGLLAVMCGCVVLVVGMVAAINLAVPIW